MQEKKKKKQEGDYKQRIKKNERRGFTAKGGERFKLIVFIVFQLLKKKKIQTKFPELEPSGLCKKKK